MFNTLLLYKDFEYFSVNRYIQFDTIHEQHGFWKIFAVIELNTSNAPFYYQQIQFNDETEFSELIEKVKEKSLHETDIDITFQDRILTLSTCDRSRYGRDGRFIILAVRMQTDFTYS